MPLQLLRDRIQVIPDPERDDVTQAGIIVKVAGTIESQRHMGRTGEVVAIGEDVDPDDVKPGDRIIWGEFDFPKYEENGKKYLILQDKDICAVLEHEEEREAQTA